MDKLTIIKLGGSFITDKSKPYTLNKKAIQLAAKEIAACRENGSIQDLVIVHGVGSYGHPPVLKNELHKGFKHPSQLLAMTSTQIEVNQLRTFLMEELLKAGVPAFLTHASSIFTADKMQIKSASTDAIEGYLKTGMVPVIGGDMLADETMGFSVGSGDLLTIWLAEHLKSKEIIFISDVNGVFHSDPKKDPKARVIPEINMTDMEGVLEELRKTKPDDASGGMAGKLQSMKSARPLLENGVKICILSLLQMGDLNRFIAFGNNTGTRLTL
jgi:isopentenyl phosphate kinase